MVAWMVDCLDDLMVGWKELQTVDCWVSQMEPLMVALKVDCLVG